MLDSEPCNVHDLMLSIYKIFWLIFGMYNTNYLKPQLKFELYLVSYWGRNRIAIHLNCLSLISCFKLPSIPKSFKAQMPSHVCQININHLTTYNILVLLQAEVEGLRAAEHKIDETIWWVGWLTKI